MPVGKGKLVAEHDEPRIVGFDIAGQQTMAGAVGVDEDLVAKKAGVIHFRFRPNANDLDVRKADSCPCARVQVSGC